MEFSFTKEQLAFQDEFRAWLRSELTPEVVEANSDPTEPSGYTPEFLYQFRKKMAAKRYMTMGWPKEYGGGGMDLVSQLIVHDEISYHRAPPPDLGVSLVGPPLMLFGTEEQKQFYLPRIASADSRFFMGYSEPGAGSDLASLQTRAVADGDDFIINGQKIYSSSAHQAHYAWLATRTDPNVPKHKGISLFIVDLNTPGVVVLPIKTTAGWYHHQVFFDNVRIPKSALVGELNRGWYQVMGAIDYERAFIAHTGAAQGSFDALLRYVKETKINGEPLSKDPIIRHKLADAAIELEAARLISYWIAWMQAKGLHPDWQTSVGSIAQRDVSRRVLELGMEIMGPYSNLKRASKWAPSSADVTQEFMDGGIVNLFAAGGLDISRNIIAQRGLGLPRG